MPSLVYTTTQQSVGRILGTAPGAPQFTATTRNYVEWWTSPNLVKNEDSVATLPANAAVNGNGALVSMNAASMSISPSTIPASAIVADPGNPNVYTINQFEVTITWPDDAAWDDLTFSVNLYRQLDASKYVRITLSFTPPGFTWYPDNTGHTGSLIATFESQRNDEENSYTVDFMAYVQPTYLLEGTPPSYVAHAGAAPTIEVKQGEAMLSASTLSLVFAGTFFPSGQITHQTLYRGSFTFNFSRTEANQPIRIRLIDEFGRRTKWYRVAFRPMPIFTFTVDGNDVSFDGSASYDPDGEVAQWFYADNGSAWGFLFDEATGIGTIDEDGDYQAYLQVTDNENLFAESARQPLTIEGSALIGSFIDKSGVLYTAVNDGQNVQVSRFKSGTASRELLALVENAKNPSLFKIGGTVYLAYTDRNDDCAKICKSTDGAKTFGMPATIWDETYQNATVQPTADGGAISGAVKKSTSPVQYEYRRSADVMTWASAPIVIGAAASGKVVHVHQKIASGQSTLIATNGVQVWQSTDKGKHWDPL